MGLALKDLSSGIEMKLWKSFLAVSLNYSGNILIGLGWAIAETKQKDLSFLNKMNQLLQFRVWDGCGYYDGIFRQRHTVVNQTRQEYVPEINFKAYDEGVGRSIWYSAKGDIAKVKETINGFTSSRQPDLWRGIGIACSFVGGCEELVFKTLLSSAEKNSVQLAIGAAMVAKTRVQSGGINKDIELACEIFCNLSKVGAAQLVINAEKSAEGSYDRWLSLMETSLPKN